MWFWKHSKGLYSNRISINIWSALPKYSVWSFEVQHKMAAVCWQPLLFLQLNSMLKYVSDNIWIRKSTVKYRNLDLNLFSLVSRVCSDAASFVFVWDAGAVVQHLISYFSRLEFFCLLQLHCNIFKLISLHHTSITAATGTVSLLFATLFLLILEKYYLISSVDKIKGVIFITYYYTTFVFYYLSMKWQLH